MAKHTDNNIDKRPIDHILSPFQEFFKLEASSGILLIIATVIALIWANSLIGESYFALWETEISIRIGTFEISKDLTHWINDGLMVIFFFVVGLEIKREVLVGELSTRRQAFLPIVAASGGMIVPAAIYLIFNINELTQQGWGIPMATDIAFALGVLSLLGNRIPLSLKVFLTAVSIADDLGAIMVIAFFYTDHIVWLSLLIAMLILILLIITNLLGVRNLLVYSFLGIILWLAFLQSGVHATIAGILLAMTIPVRTRINSDEFVTNASYFLEDFRRHAQAGESILIDKNQLSSLKSIEVAAEHAQTPLQRLEHSLHPWVVFFIMPVFAFANAGVVIKGDLLNTLSQPVTMGVMAGLIVGKQIGVFFASYFAIKLSWAELPAGMTWLRLYGLAWLAGIGFTMSLFIANLAFTDSTSLDSAKTGILIASLIAGSVGAYILNKAKG